MFLLLIMMRTLRCIQVLMLFKNGENFLNFGPIWTNRGLLQGMENSRIFQNAGEGLEKNGFSRKLNHKPWPLPVLNMLTNNWNSISANFVMLQQQRKCKICKKTDTPLWRKGPDGTDLSYTSQD